MCRLETRLTIISSGLTYRVPTAGEVLAVVRAREIVWPNEVCKFTERFVFVDNIDFS